MGWFGAASDSASCPVDRLIVPLPVLKVDVQCVSHKVSICVRAELQTIQVRSLHRGPTAPVAFPRIVA